jgi:hypothetical protein
LKLALGVATLLIYIRSVYRVAELSEGFTGSIANQEIPYMFFEPVMISVACICLLAWHPSFVFGDQWQAADYRVGKGDKDTKLELGVSGKAFSSTFSTPSERSLVSRGNPDLDQQSNQETAGYWVGSHKPGCPRANPRANLPLMRQQENSITKPQSSFHQPHCPHANDSRIPAVGREDYTTAGEYTNSSGLNVPGAVTPRTPLMKEGDHTAVEIYTSSHQPNKLGAFTPRTPLTRDGDLGTGTENYTSSHQPNISGAVTPRTPLMKQQNYDRRTEW